MATQYIGLTSAPIFDYSRVPKHPRQVIFEEVPDQADDVYCVSEFVQPPAQIIRLGQRPNLGVITILEPSQIRAYGNQMAEYMQVFRDTVDSAKLQQELDAEHKVKDLTGRRSLNLIMETLKSTGLVQRDSKYSRLDGKVDEILRAPFTHFPDGDYQGHIAKVVAMSEQENPCYDDGLSFEGDLQTGLNFAFSHGPLVFDLFVAQQLGAQLLTNTRTKPTLNHAQRLLEIIKDGDVERYFGFK
jgi:hypothetical protein